MKTRNRIIAAAFFTAVTDGASVAVAGADEGMPRNLVTAMKADEGVPQNLVAAARPEGRSFPDFNVALRADEGVPRDLVTG